MQNKMVRLKRFIVTRDKFEQKWRKAKEVRRVAAVAIKKNEDEGRNCPRKLPAPPSWCHWRCRSHSDVRTGRRTATHGRLPEHFPAVFWTTFQSVTLGREAAPEKANESSDTPTNTTKKKKRIKMEPQLIREKTTLSIKHEVVVFQRLIFSDEVWVRSLWGEKRLCKFNKYAFFGLKESTLEKLENPALL